MFYGIIQKVEGSNDRLIIRCVRDFFHGDGLMSDDVWLWEIEHPEEEKSALLRSMIGRDVVGFEVNESEGRQSLSIWLDEGDETISISGKRIGKREEQRDKSDLEEVVAHLSLRVSRDEAEYLALNRKLAAVATFAEQMIDRIKRRAEFEQQRESGKAEGFSREIEDIQSILKKLREPDQPTSPKGL